MARQILIVAATEAEIAPLLHHFANEKPFDVLITGVGMVATAFALGSQVNVKKYDLAINLGIAGSFDRSIALGDVVEVIADELSELGAESDEMFIPIAQLGFGESRYMAGSALRYHTQTLKLKTVSAITVNTVHGNEASIEKVALRLAPQLESMEGAAFFYSCEKTGVKGIQIRAVSNYVEKRNRDNWQIGLAIKNLNSFAISLLEELTSGR
ncbi:futalosine hydrolase [Mucilaginibacter sp. HMF5004]|uniref:futalosine hydrolase n=1 Tax=Mucilaginibacter rivuli TaxID=2857527 RepID=UPI001C601DAD|nr:futalosine hydrolase [Mucilaginibacter rivuli]MBW4890429.1 futalosine hydrolase [Mucilaginibacter rivuli]